ncbi:MAG: phospho-N-acetylmuramoyl-pentapeptide-transferase [Acidobacteriota bacterium]|jgi:phospho-N-acetylmuramoyl-pentapeptide-transferase|nr:phospho-N-acetylmuramoyl-pentapeptide-transferase [Acidobacteriota bacterium]
MIYLLGRLLHPHFGAFSFLRLAEYISARAIGAALTAILLTLYLTPIIIRYLHRRGLVDQWRNTGVDAAFDKAGTPAMGGAIVAGCVFISCLLWCNLANLFLVVVLLGMVWFGAIGFFDDLAKARFHSGDMGMSEAKKLVLQGLFAVLFVALMASSWSPLPPSQLGAFHVPFVKVPIFQSIWIYAPIVFFFVIVVGNSINIADGMDGLAIVPSVFVIGVLGLFGYFLGNAIYAPYLNYPFLPGAGELAVFASAFAGAGIGFLWFNAYPAQIFMGDTGSMAIGGAVATTCVVLQQEVLFLILGGMFLAEAVTSQIQDKIGVRWLGRRIFMRAPMHHQMQHKGLAETKVVIRLWIISGILALAALATLKLR